MGKADKLKEKLLKGQSYQNFRFEDLVYLLNSLGFEQARTQGSHPIFTHPKSPKLVNVQNIKGNAKPYPLRQIRAMIL